MDCIDLYSNFYNTDKADKYFDELMKLNLTSTLKTKFDDTEVEIPRKIGYFSDNGEDYPYANLILKGQTWEPVLLNIKTDLENRLGKKFNSVLVNLYRDGNDTINWHSDSEPQLGKNPTIASVNFGASRVFKFKEKVKGEKAKYDFLLEHGTVIVMRDDCQEKWLHSIRRDFSVTKPRFNLTYRYVY
jgi:alkylated DNA repair dioxygenase AlkB